MAALERVLMVTEDHSAVSGGVAAVVHALAGRIAAKGVEVEILCVRSAPIPPSLGVSVVQRLPSSIGRKWGWSRGLANAIEASLQRKRGTVVHLHGVWTAPQLFAARAALRADVPFLLTAHAMLQRWFWTGQGWITWLKKSDYWRLFGKPAFRRATVLHAVTSSEREAMT